MRKIKKTVPVLMAILMAASMSVSMAGCGNKDKGASNTATESQSKDASTSEKTSSSEAFPKFKGYDFDGNSVDESIFAKNDVTLLNFWFNGCSACQNEMPQLEKLNAKLREKNAELVGVNIEANGNEKALKEAKEILSKQGATYKNIFVSEGKEAQEYISKIFGFPTTILVDKSGNIIGKPILGSIDDEKKTDEILKMVDDIRAGKGTTETNTAETSDYKRAALMAEENKIFVDHKDVWDKLFDNIDKESLDQPTETSYAGFLKSQIEKLKDKFSDDELKTLNDDMKKIDDLENQMEELDNAE